MLRDHGIYACMTVMTGSTCTALHDVEKSCPIYPQFHEQEQVREIASPAGARLHGATTGTTCICVAIRASR